MQYNYAGKMKYLSCKNSDILYCKHLSCRVQCALFLSGAFAHQPYKGRLGGNVSYILCTLRPCHFQGFCMGDTLLVSLSFSCFTVGQSTIFHNRIFRIVHRKLHHFYTALYQGAYTLAAFLKVIRGLIVAYAICLLLQQVFGLSAYIIFLQLT